MTTSPESEHGTWQAMQSSWVRGSSRRLSVLLKIAVKEEFGLAPEVWKRGQHKLTDDQVAEARRAVRRVYEETQADLRASGVTVVRLYRGVSSPIAARGVLEGWTSDLDVAEEFGEYDIMEAAVPASRVLAYSRGPSWQNGPHGEESEFLVLGGEPQ